MMISRKSVINLFLMLSMALLLACMYFAYWQIQRWLSANKWVMHTYAVIETTDKALLALMQLEMQKNDLAYSQKKSAATILPTQLNLFQQQIQQLSRLTSDNKIQQEKLKQLNPLLSRQANFIQHMLYLNKNNPSEVKHWIESTNTQERVNQTFNLLNTIKQEELQLLNDRIQFFNRDASRTIVALALSASLSIFLILFTFGLINYHLNKLEKANAEKAELESRLKKIIDGSNDLVAAIDSNFKLLAFNTAYEKMVKRLVNKEVAMGDNIKTIFADKPYLHEMIAAWQRALSGEEFIITLPLDTRKREQHFYEGVFSNIRDISGKQIGVAHIMRDVTERKKVDNLKNEFISVVSHELRTPLTSIKGSLSLLLGGNLGILDDKTKNMLTIAYNNTERLINLINDMLDIEKIEFGNLNFHFEKLALDKLLMESITANQSFADKYQVKIKISQSLPNIFISGDHDRLMQVITNILSNAVKFSKPDSEVLVALQPQQTYVRIAIEDHGQGIPDEFKEHIFKKFSQADSSSVRQHGGSGLGLSISKSIVENHGGKISFVSQLNVGTTFFIDLPILKQVNLSKENLTENNQQKKILYIEDDVDLSEVITNLLIQDASVVQVYDKNHAKKLLKAAKYDLILLDLVLPDGNGLDLLPSMSELKVPIIVFSAHEVPKEYMRYVKKALVKSKASNKTLIETVRHELKVQPTTNFNS